MSAEFEKLLPTLVIGGVDFILVGGVAGIVHGAARATYDVDLVYSRSDANIERLAHTLGPHARMEAVSSQRVSSWRNRRSLFSSSGVSEGHARSSISLITEMP